MIAALVLIALSGAPPAVDAAKVCQRRANHGAAGGREGRLRQLRARRAGDARKIGGALAALFGRRALGLPRRRRRRRGEQRRAVDLPRDAAGRQPEPAERRRRRRLELVAAAAARPAARRQAIAPLPSRRRSRVAGRPHRETNRGNARRANRTGRCSDPCAGVVAWRTTIWRPRSKRPTARWRCDAARRGRRRSGRWPCWRGAPSRPVDGGGPSALGLIRQSFLFKCLADPFPARRP